jgi:glycosyltransferase involved in cell wall biosynthesis
VPALVQRMHVAAALIRPCYSKMASAPTKLAEYLGCGVPCLGNAGVGDVHEILEGNRVGVSLVDFAPGTVSDAVHRLVALAEDPATSARCVATARRLFSREDGVARYERIYAELSGATGRAEVASRAVEPA